MYQHGSKYRAICRCNLLDRQLSVGRLADNLSRGDGWLAIAGLAGHLSQSGTSEEKDGC